MQSCPKCCAPAHISPEICQLNCLLLHMLRQKYLLCHGSSLSLQALLQLCNEKKKKKTQSSLARKRAFGLSVESIFQCACPPVQRGPNMSGYLAKVSPWTTAYVSEQYIFWRDCSTAQARLNIFLFACVVTILFP